MTGSDKKDQGFSATSDGTVPQEFQDLDVSHFTIPGDAKGLIPRKNLDNDLTTTISMWAGTPVGRTDTFRLQWVRKGSDDWANFTEHTYSNNDPLPMVFTIPTQFLLGTENEGDFVLRYEHENYLNVIEWSNPVPICIDKVPPNGVFAPERMVFDFSSPITDATFGEHDYLEARIPPWAGDQTDVQVKFAWLKAELPEDPGDIVQIGPLPISPYGTVQIPKTQVVAAGNGRCCGIYVLIDKAGNISRYSKYQLMDVALSQ